MLALASVLGVIVVGVWMIAGAGSNSATERHVGGRVGTASVGRTQGGSAKAAPKRSAAHSDGAPAAGSARAAASGRAATSTAASTAARLAPYGVGIIRLRLVDTSRTVALPGGVTRPRTLVTSVRYPAVGRPGGAEHLGAAPAAGPFPLIVFGHGFDVTPGIYARLLDAWAAAGYVVAAPTFPLGNAQAPGGPNEHDLPNQPRDMSFVITRLLAANTAARAPLHQLIDRRRIAVAGQSDGGDTALAAAYDPRDRDPRISAAVILSGAYDPFASTFRIAPGGPPLVAIQGTADPINPPSATAAFYDPAPPPKYLLELPGAGHLPPYTDAQPQLGVVERVTVAFLDEYLKQEPAARARMTRAANVAGVAALSADP